ncbi:MAG TPA: hypothetical protein VLX90_14640 [Steroidobacteraceae bacterium]|nr:hypothetical protein [Steroidobacteraceae bacterium]
MRRSRIENGPLAPRSWLGTEARVVRHVHTCGSGHLANATRVELARLGIQRDSDYLLPPLHPPLVIACADSEADASVNDVAARATAGGSPLLLACIAGPMLRIGPLIEPGRDALAEPFSCPPPRSGNDTAPPGVAEADPRLSLRARLGALLVGAQVLSFLLGARRHCVLNRVVEVNPWSIESKAYRVIKVRH